MEGCDADAALWLMERRARAGPDPPASRCCFTSRHIIKRLRPLSGYTWPRPARASCRQIRLTAVSRSPPGERVLNASGGQSASQATERRGQRLIVEMSLLSCFVLHIDIISPYVFASRHMSNGAQQQRGRGGGEVGGVWAGLEVHIMHARPCSSKFS